MALCPLEYEAADCRSMAYEFQGHPEEALLLRIAEEFDRLAVERDWPLGFNAKDLSYFAKRATQETTAAVRATNPKARLAHLRMAQRYARLSRPVKAH